jgi:5-formyltetrahydrofolate cyclo-ligase
MTLSKQQQRLQAYKARDNQINKEGLSSIICHKLRQHPSYQTASTVMIYLHCRSEVRTQAFVKTLLRTNKRIVIPYCTQDKLGHNKLGLWHLDNLNELISGTWGILEPPKTKWDDLSKQLHPEQLDLVIVPGVAFSPQGARLGNGAGYYDRLLNQVRRDCVLIGIAYEAQLFEEIQMDRYDIYMDFVLTEKQLYSRL